MPIVPVAKTIDKSSVSKLQYTLFYAMWYLKWLLNMLSAFWCQSIGFDIETNINNRRMFAKK